MRDLILLGGGHAHVAVIKELGLHPLADVRASLVSPSRYTPYSGMLPGLIAGHYTFEEAHIDLERLCAFATARFVIDEAIGLDPGKQRVICRDGGEIAYDLCSIDIGSAPNTTKVHGASGHALPVKPIARFLSAWDALRERAMAADRPFRIAVGGGGAGGTELAFSVQHALRETHASLGLFTDRSEIVPSHSKGARRRLMRQLAQKDIAVHTGGEVAEVTGQGLRLASGAFHAFDAVLWTTEAAAPEWLRETGLTLTLDGFIAVTDTLQSTSHENVFAAGDVATMIHHAREKAGVVAVRQGPSLTRNLHRLLSGLAPEPFVPQSRWLSLVSTGHKNAVASWYALSAEGRLVWQWKDWIDRRFMARYSDLRASL